MKELIRLKKAEQMKIMHTPIPVIHFLVPIAGVFVFLAYYYVTEHSYQQELSAYMQVLAVSLPLVISILCSLSVGIEESSHFHILLGSGARKGNVFLAKLSALSVWGLGAFVIAIAGMAFGQKYVLSEKICEAEMYAAMVVCMWLCSLILYCFHLFLNLQWAKSISICIGAVESLTAALMLTGLGEGIWQYLPCAFCGRWEEYLLLYYTGSIENRARMLSFKILFPNVFITIIVWAAVFIWFHFYEGRQVND